MIFHRVLTEIYELNCTYAYGMYMYVVQLFLHILDFLFKFYLDKYGNYLLIVLPAMMIFVGKIKGFTFPNFY